MQVLINNKVAMLPKDFSMSLDFENRFFTQKTEEWSLDFDLPLRGCPQNIAIFGNVYRKDIKLTAVSYPCEISHATFRKKGIVVPISVNETSISLQFLAGRSQVNYVSTLESTCIRDISLPMTLQISKVACLANAQHDIDDGRTELCLPWVNNYSGNVQNHLDLDNPVTDPDTGLTYYYFDSDTTQVSCQIYLIELTRRILVTLGYSVDLTAWSNTVWKYLLVWNAVPAAWNEHNFNIALPKWTVIEFLEQIELLTGLDFDINEEGKIVTVRNSRAEVNALGTVVLNDIEEQFEMDIDESSLEFREACELKYADRGDNEWEYEACTTAIQRMLDDGVLDNTPVSYANWTCGGLSPDITNDRRDLDGDTKYIQERKSYFKRKLYDAVDAISYFQYKTKFFFMNMFGQTSSDEESNFKEIKILPARVIHTIDSLMAGTYDYVAMDPGEYDEGDIEEPTTLEEAKAYRDKTARYIEDENETQEYYSHLYVTFWKKEFAYTKKDGNNQPYCLNHNISQFGIRDRQQNPLDGEGYMYHYMGPAWAYKWNELKFYSNMTLSLRATEHQSMFLEQVDGTKKYTFRWLSKNVPDVKSVFVINGRRFYCSVIKTKWDIHGMSEELEGEFYEIL